MISILNFEKDNIWVDIFLRKLFDLESRYIKKRYHPIRKNVEPKSKQFLIRILTKR